MCEGQPRGFNGVKNIFSLTFPSPTPWYEIGREYLLRMKELDLRSIENGAQGECVLLLVAVVFVLHRVRWGLRTADR